MYVSLEFSRVFISFSVPPHQILVYDASGRDVAGSVGPLLEDNNLVLTCEVRGGEYYNILIHHHTDLIPCDYENIYLLMCIQINQSCKFLLKNFPDKNNFLIKKLL